jgi:hypothetical protein
MLLPGSANGTDLLQPVYPQRPHVEQPIADFVE